MAKRFYVVHDCRAHVEAQHRWEIRWLDSRVAALAFQRFNQASLFATDISACPAVDVNLGIKSRAKNVFSKKIMLTRFFDGALKDFCPLREFTSDVDVSRARVQREAGDQNSFEELMC